MKKTILPIYLMMLFLTFGSFTIPANIEKMSLKYVVRELNKNIHTRVEMEIHFQKTGKMVTHFLYPFEYVMLTNENGEFLLYDPKNNTVKKGQNLLLSSNFTTLGFFLNDQTKDFGLTEMGFKIESSKIVEGTLVTLWKAPEGYRADISKIELVHNKNKPIFMGYLDAKNKYVRKSFYYNYMDNKNFMLPSSITEINYTADGDSIVSKSAISDVKINDQANSSYYNFTIPSDAQIIK